MCKFLFNGKMKMFGSLFFLLTMTSSLFAATYYSDPTSSSVPLMKDSVDKGWSINAAGPFTAKVKFNKGDNLIIQAGSTVTSSGGGLTFGSITFTGGTLIMGATSFNALGNITGTGTYSNPDDLVTRIKMVGSNKTINAELTGNGGITIVRNVALTGNTTIGGRVAFDSTGSLDLAGFNLTADNFIMKNGSTIKGNPASSLAIQSTVANESIMYFNPEFNKLASLSINTEGSLKLNSDAAIGAVSLTAGRIILGANYLTAGRIIGGSAASYIVTDGTGLLICSVAAGATQLLPIGGSNAKKYTTYEPVSLTPKKATTFTIGVKNALTNPVANAKAVAGREWSILSATPSETVLSITPKNPVVTKVPTIAMNVEGVWLEMPTTRSGNTFTCKTKDFSLFCAGEQGAF